jgi:lactam utilization protein B
MSRTKYGNIKHQGYDSKKEARRAAELHILEKAGIISNVQQQVKYELLPSQYAVINNKKKCIERSVCYYADFTYMKNGMLVVEDVKSPVTRTTEYIIKRKLMLYIYHIQIREIYA